jgi:hypothetical protein
MWYLTEIYHNDWSEYEKYIELKERNTSTYSLYFTDESDDIKCITISNKIKDIPKFIADELGTHDFTGMVNEATFMVMDKLSCSLYKLLDYKGVYAGDEKLDLVSLYYVFMPYVYVFGDDVTLFELIMKFGSLYEIRDDMLFIKVIEDDDVDKVEKIHYFKINNLVEFRRFVTKYKILKG